MKKRLLSMILTILMLLSLLPTTALAAEAYVVVAGVNVASGYYLAEGKTYAQKTKPSGGYAYYKDGTLTLHDYVFEGKGTKFSGDHTAVVYCKGALTVKLEGANGLYNLNSDKYSNGAEGYAIYADGKLTLKGTVEDSLVTLATKAGMGSKTSISVNGGCYGFSGDGYFPEFGFYAKGGTLTMKNALVVTTEVRYETFRSSGNITLTDCEVVAESCGCLLQTDDGDIIIDGGYMLASVRVEFANSSKGPHKFIVRGDAEIYAETIYSGDWLFGSNLEIVLEDNLKGYGSIWDDGRDMEEIWRPTYEVIHIAPYLHYHQGNGQIIAEETYHWMECTDPDCPVAVDGAIREPHYYATAASVVCSVCKHNRYYDEVIIGGVALSDGDYLASGGTHTVRTKPEGGYAYYAEGILVLSNFTYSGAGVEYYPDYNSAAVFCQHDLEIVLDGSNSITANNNAVGADALVTYKCEDRSANLTISGSGSLALSAPKCAIRSGEALTVENTSLTMKKGSVSVTRGNIVIRNANLTSKAEITTNPDLAMTIADSTLKGTKISTGTLNVQNSNVTLSAETITYVATSILDSTVTTTGIMQLSNASIRGSTFTVAPKNTLYALWLLNNAEIVNSVVIVDATYTAISAGGTLSISGSYVEASGGRDVLVGSYQYRYPSQALAVENSRVVLRCTNTAEYYDYRAMNVTTLELGEGCTISASKSLNGTLGAYNAAQQGEYKVIAIDCEGALDYTRISGKNRAKTAIAVADELKNELGVTAFDTMILSSGTNFADALAGSYLAAAKSAPILLYTKSTANETVSYILNNISAEGVVYLLGGTGAVPADVEASLTDAGVTVVRLSGKDRFATNLLILQEAGIEAGQEILVCTGYNFADSLSASATGLPILLVNSNKGKLTDAQLAFLEEVSAEGNLQLTIIGGTGAVPAALEEALRAYGTTDRISGKDRYATSVLIAERYFDAPATAFITYGKNFPDGLSGGPLAYAMGAPLLLVQDGKEPIPAHYLDSCGVSEFYVLGGSGAVSDITALRTFYGGTH